MKTLAISALLVLLLSASAFRPQDTNPLINTAWQGPVLMDQERAIIFHFKPADTLKMYMADGMNLEETMRYTVNNNVLTMQKLQGNSPCDTQTVGQYQFGVVNEELNLKPVTDGCDARRQAWLGKPFKKVALPTK